MRILLLPASQVLELDKTTMFNSLKESFENIVGKHHHKSNTEPEVTHMPNSNTNGDSGAEVIEILVTPCRERPTRS